MNAQLGASATLGTRSWQAQHKFRIVLGPLARDDYERFLPGGDSLPRLTAWVRNYVGDSLDWDLQLKLRPEAVPALTLGGRHGAGARLGLTTWVTGRVATRQVDRLHLVPRSLH